MKLVIIGGDTDGCAIRYWRGSKSYKIGGFIFGRLNPVGRQRWLKMI